MLVTPVWDEPYGLVVAEALACGTPVVAFARGGVPEILSDPAAGRLVPADDVAAMAGAVAAEVAAWTAGRCGRTPSSTSPTTGWCATTRRSTAGWPRR